MDDSFSNILISLLAWPLQETEKWGYYCLPYQRYVVHTIISLARSKARVAETQPIFTLSRFSVGDVHHRHGYGFPVLAALTKKSEYHAACKYMSIGALKSMELTVVS